MFVEILQIRKVKQIIVLAGEFAEVVIVILVFVVHFSPTRIACIVCVCRNAFNPPLNSEFAVDSVSLSLTPKGSLWKNE